jgi:hypothetical protein
MPPAPPGPLPPKCWLLEWMFRLYEARRHAADELAKSQGKNTSSSSSKTAILEWQTAVNESLAEQTLKLIRSSCAASVGRGDTSPSVSSSSPSASDSSSVTSTALALIGAALVYSRTDAHVSAFVSFLNETAPLAQLMAYLNAAEGALSLPLPVSVSVPSSASLPSPTGSDHPTKSKQPPPTSTAAAAAHGPPAGGFAAFSRVYHSINALQRAHACLPVLPLSLADLAAERNRNAAFGGASGRSLRYRWSDESQL